MIITEGGNVISFS